MALCSKRKIFSLSPWHLSYCEVINSCMRVCTDIGEISSGPFIFHSLSFLFDTILRLHIIIYSLLYNLILSNFRRDFRTLHYIFVSNSSLHFALAAKVQRSVHGHTIASRNCAFGNKPFLKNHLHRKFCLSVTP